MFRQQTGPLPAVSALRLNTVLTKLTLYDVDAGGIAKLVGVLSELPTLKTLEMEYCRIGSGGAKHLGKYNSHCKCPGLTLETVDIRKVAADIYFCSCLIITIICIQCNRLYLALPLSPA